MFPPKKKIRVVIADDHPLMRLGLRAKLSGEPDFEIVAEAEDGLAAVAAYVTHRPDVLLLDLRMPGLEGTQVIEEIRKTDPDAKVVILTTYDTDEEVYRAVQAGARGYVLKGAFAEGVLEALRAVNAGRRLIAPEVAERLAARLASRQLSAREVAVLQLVARGMSNKEIGAKLFVSEATIKFHLKNIYAKLGASDRTEAALMASRKGIIPSANR